MHMMPADEDAPADAARLDYLPVGLDTCDDS